jgi:hypothetical protein
MSQTSLGSTRLPPHGEAPFELNMTRIDIEPKVQGAECSVVSGPSVDRFPESCRVTAGVAGPGAVAHGGELG